LQLSQTADNIDKWCTVYCAITLITYYTEKTCYLRSEVIYLRSLLINHHWIACNLVYMLL